MKDQVVKVYVGSQPEQMLSVRVLEHSIKKHASIPVEVIPLFKNDIKYPMPKKKENMPRTPFSFQRFLIPQLNNFSGRAIYVDSDMQVFTDIKNLWTKDMTNADLLSAYESDGTSRKPQFSVMLMDCEKLKWNISEIVERLDRDELTYESLMYQMKVANAIETSIEREWNSLEFYEKGKTNLLHFTDMNRQPWLFTNNQLVPIWIEGLYDAVSDGFISWTELRSYITQGHVRPSVWYQIKNKKFKIEEVPSGAFKADIFFIPPHKRKNTTSEKIKLVMNSIWSRLFTTF